MPEQRFGIREWFGKPLQSLSAIDRERFAAISLSPRDEVAGSIPGCPFQSGSPACSKRGGVCSIQRYDRNPDGTLGSAAGDPVVVCPAHFEQAQLPIRWLAEIVGFVAGEAMLAREVAFMQGTRTNKPAGKIDLVVARTRGGDLEWFGLEIQAVYFSGPSMRSEFENLRDSTGPRANFPNAVRRPDWRSSSAKRLMPQLQIKVPTLRRWGSKMAVAVDRPFFDSIGGASSNPSQDLADGDIVWLVVDLQSDVSGSLQLTRGHWEVLTLEESCERLLAARTVQRDAFLDALRNKLRPLRTAD